ncbi:MAG: glycosyltransferase [Proteobacteria bacterium]|nr:glycosyltransferase [Pseudomonadota bacterium]
MAQSTIQVVTSVAALSVAIWLYLIFFRGGFWRADQRLGEGLGEAVAGGEWPDIAVVVPARDEAPLIGRTMTALLAQDYPGRYGVVLVDDGSGDGTAEIAHAAACERGAEQRLTIVRATPPPMGWTGKLWALATGVERAAETLPGARYILFTDADIEHHPATLRLLAAKAEAERLDLVSLMALLACKTPWERLLVPAFVYFFQKLYPFAWVNDPARQAAAAAGGCVLVRRDALAAAGGIAAISGALIDDCALARLIKRHGAIWLGLTATSRGIRPHGGLEDIWTMVARTAFFQLRHSAVLLAAAVAGMLVIYMAPPAALAGGLLVGDGSLAGLGLAGCLFMAAAYGATLRLYRQPLWAAVFLPVAALLYVAMTIDSAFRHWRGRGGRWKGRIHDG